MIEYNDITVDENNMHFYTDKAVEEGILYHNCKINIPLSFVYSQIKGRVCFENCEFLCNVIFGNLDNVTCCSIDQNIEFRSCIFNDQLLLDGISCGGSIVIEDCKFIEENEIGLAIRSAHIANSLVIRNSILKSGLNFDNSTIDLVGCIFENVIVDNEVSSISFRSCHLNKQLQFLGYTLNVMDLDFTRLSLDNSNGFVFISGIYCFRFTEEEELTDERVSFHFVEEGFNEYPIKYVKIGNHIAVYYGKEQFILEKCENSRYLVYKCCVIDTQLINFCNSDMGNEFISEHSILSSTQIRFDESSVGNWRIRNSIITTAFLCHKNSTVRNCLDFSNNTVQLFKDSFIKEVGLCFDFIVIDNNVNFTNNWVKANSETCRIDFRHACVGGDFNLSDFDTTNTVFSLQRTTIKTFDISVSLQVPIRFEFEDLVTEHFRINKQLPDCTILKSIIPSVRPREKKKNDILLSIASGEIGILRKCQEQLAEDQDSDTEANKIWRLRNDLSVLKQNNYKKRFSYWTSLYWKRLTDYGLSSSNLVIAVIVMFALYSAVNYLCLSRNPMDDGSLIGQSLIQYIPTIDFGSELNIINFESHLPSWYKYVVIFGRITGFILISILVASFAGVWEGRNK